MKTEEHLRLGQILVDRGIATPGQLEEALEEQKNTGRFFGEILIRRGVAGEEQIMEALSQQLGIAYVNVSEMALEPAAQERVPEELCARHNLVPLFISQNTLTVAMANALDVQAIDDVQKASGLRVRPVFACPTPIREVIKKQYKDKAPAVAPSIARGADPGPFESKASPSEPAEQAANYAPVVEMVNRIITQAVEMNASDIHLEPQREAFICRYRIDGVLYPMQQIRTKDQAPVISRIKIMAAMDIAEKRLPQDGRIRLFASGRDVDLRVSTFPCLYGENVVIRILDRSSGLLRLSDLGFSADNLKKFLSLIYRPYGMILVTGPTGSGKTTTLYGALSEIKAVEKNVLTLEDPVEYELPHVRQSQINVKAGLTFAAGLRSMLRQDPDIIMIGEIRDRETADIAIHAALTGHLVFSTLHTNDAPSAASRLIDMGVEPFLIASSLVGVLAQRLVRVLCPACKEAYVPTHEVWESLNFSSLSPKPVRIFQEKGCEKCKKIGYVGRMGIYELMIPSERVKELVAERVSVAKIREEAALAGMKTLRQSGMEKVIQGQTSISELLRVTEEA